MHSSHWNNYIFLMMAPGIGALKGNALSFSVSVLALDDFQAWCVIFIKRQL